MIKSDNPDLLVNIFTKERERIDVNQYNAGWGYGWGTDGTLLMGRSQLCQQQQKERSILT
jgi:hypothetical protein